MIWPFSAFAERKKELAERKQATAKHNDLVNTAVLRLLLHLGSSYFDDADKIRRNIAEAERIEAWAKIADLPDAQRAAYLNWTDYFIRNGKKALAENQRRRSSAYIEQRQCEEEARRAKDILVDAEQEKLIKPP